MNFSSHQVIYETFHKRGMGYECVISPKKISSECNNFHVIVKTEIMMIIYNSTCFLPEMAIGYRMIKN